MTNRFTSNYLHDDDNDDDIVSMQAKNLIREWINGRIVDDLTSSSTTTTEDEKQPEISLQILKDYERRITRGEPPKTSRRQLDFSAGDCPHHQEEVDEIIQRLRKASIPGVSPEYIHKVAREAMTSRKGGSGVARKMEKRWEAIAAAREEREERAKMRREELKRRKEEREVEEKRREVEERKTDKKRKEEEEQIRREMNKLRRELVQKRKKNLEVRHQVVEKPASLSARVEVFEVLPPTTPQQMKLPPRMVDNHIYLASKKRNYRCVKFHFTTWYKYVLGRKALAAKARALADWKLLQLAWNGWRRIAMQAVSERQSATFQHEVSSMKLRTRQAETQHKVALMRKCFNSWRRFVKIQFHFAESEHKTEETRAKMKAFLDALSSKPASAPPAAAEEQDLTNERISWVDPPMQSTPVKPNNKFSLSAFHKQKAVMLKQSSIIAQQNKVIAQLQTQPEPTTSSSSAIPHKKIESRPPPSSNNPPPAAAKKLPDRPRWVRDMEARAAERQQKHEEMRLFRMERDRERHVREEEERLEEQGREERAKREKIRRQREERRAKEEKEKQRGEYLAWLRDAQSRADRHYSRASLQYRGVAPWRRLVIKGREQNRCAVQFNMRHVLVTSLRSWHRYVAERVRGRREVADRFHGVLCVRRAVTRWRLYGERMTILEEKARIHHAWALKRRCFGGLCSFALDERLRIIDLDELAVVENKKRLLRRGLNLLRNFVKFQRKECERSDRLKAIHLKVLNVLPDFRPDVSVTTSFGVDD